MSISIHTIRAQTVEQLRGEINEIIKYQTVNKELQSTPVYALVIDGNSEFFLNTQQTNADPLYLDSLFCLGGASKVLGGLILAYLHYTDKIDLFEVLHFNKNERPLLFTTTLASLALHTSGLPKLPDNLASYQQSGQNPYQEYTSRAMLSFLNTVPARGKARYTYSDLGYALIEYRLSSELNIDFTEMNRIIDILPLSLSSTFIHGAPEHKIVQGYDRASRKTKPMDSKIFGLSRTAYSSLNDLKFLAKQYFNNDTLSAYPWLSYYQEAQYQNRIKNTENIYSTLGWHIMKINNTGTALIQGGVSQGHSCFIGIVPETQTAVILLTSRPVSLNSAGFNTLRMINRNWTKNINDE